MTDPEKAHDIIWKQIRNSKRGMGTYTYKGELSNKEFLLASTKLFLEECKKQNLQPIVVVDSSSEISKEELSRMV